MAFLAVIGSSSTNGVAHIHSEIIKETIFKVCSARIACSIMTCLWCHDLALGVASNLLAPSPLTPLESCQWQAHTHITVLMPRVAQSPGIVFDRLLTGFL